MCDVVLQQRQISIFIRFSLLHLDACLHNRKFGKAAPRLDTGKEESLQEVPCLQSRNKW